MSPLWVLPSALRTPWWGLSSWAQRLSLWLTWAPVHSATPSRLTERQWSGQPKDLVS